MLTLVSAQLFIPDGRIAQDGLATILEEIQCTAWLYAGEKLSTVEKQQCFLVPGLDDFLRGDYIPPYHYQESWEQSRDDIVCIVHTSGTTGTIQRYSGVFPTCTDILRQVFQSQSISATDTCLFGIVGTL